MHHENQYEEEALRQVRGDIQKQVDRQMEAITLANRHLIAVIEQMRCEIFSRFLGFMTWALILAVTMYPILLRPVSIVKQVGESGLAVFQIVYPETSNSPLAVESSRKHASPERTVTYMCASGTLLAMYQRFPDA